MDQVYDAEPADMSAEYALFNFHELCFLMDYFYGLKTEQNSGNHGKYPLDEPMGYDIIMADLLGFATAFRFSPHFKKWSPGPMIDMSCPRFIRQGTAESVGRAPACFT